MVVNNNKINLRRKQLENLDIEATYKKLLELKDWKLHNYLYRNYYEKLKYIYIEKAERGSHVKY